jgi:glycosyltransferase involved in cell wall biosynthesis
MWMLLSGPLETSTGGPLKILLLISTLGLGGAERQLVAWADILQRDLGAQVCVATFDEKRLERLPALEALDIPVVVAGRDHNPLKRVGRVVSFAHKNQPDIVHAFSFSKSTLAVGVAGLVRAVPAASFQGDGLSDMSALRAPYRRQTLARIRYFTSNSHEAIVRMRPDLPEKALLQYVPNVVATPDRQLRDSRSANDRRDLRVLAVARLDENKRIDVFLEALAAARRVAPRLTGVIVGDGPSRESLMDRASKLDLLPEGVRFTGQLLDPSEQYASADIFVHLAASEGTPNVVLEAMAMGLPVVTTAAGDLRLIIEPGENGLLVPFDDVASAAGCLVGLAGSPELRARLGEQGRLQVLRSFGVEQLRDSLNRFYSSIRPWRGVP